MSFKAMRVAMTQGFVLGSEAPTRCCGAAKRVHKENSKQAVRPSALQQQHTNRCTVGDSEVWWK